jgi:site-specific recombinase XerD
MTRRRRWEELDKASISLTQLRKAYQVFNQTVGKSPKTTEWYEQKLTLFERFAGEGCLLGDFTLERVREFIAHLQDRRVRYENNPFVKDKDGALSTSYIQGFARALRAFSTWLNEEGYTDENVLKRLKPPAIQAKVIPVLTEEEVAGILAVFDQGDPFGARDYAIIWTLLDCGLRASELCGLAVEDAHIDQGYLKVLGKGNKERLVPIGSTAQSLLARWRDVFRHQFVQADRSQLLLTATSHALTVVGLQQIVRRAGRAAGVPRLHCHLLRHTFATNYLVKEVGDPLRLQQILGHTSLEMVRRYVAMASIEQSLLERRSSPMDLFAAQQPAPRHARRLQPRRKQRLKVVR